jgi:hypothetical protein
MNVYPAHKLLSFYDQPLDYFYLNKKQPEVL